MQFLVLPLIAFDIPPDLNPDFARSMDYKDMSYNHVHFAHYFSTQHAQQN
jgi:hypothetical protein